MPERNPQYKARTNFRRTISAEECRPKKLCTVWPETADLQHPSGYVKVFGATPEPGVTYTLMDPTTGKLAVTLDGSPLSAHGVIAGIPYAFALVGPDRERDDAGEVVTNVFEAISSERHAMDVIGLAKAGVDELYQKQVSPPVSTSQLFEKGYFVPEGDNPTPEELKKAVSRREKWMDEAVRKGDAAWNRFHDHNQIPGDAMIAAKHRNITDREWSQDVRPSATSPCPVCRTFIDPRQRKCTTCGEWLAVDDDGVLYAINDPLRKNAVTPAPETAGEKKKRLAREAIENGEAE